jgi:hypothetical protein
MLVGLGCGGLALISANYHMAIYCYDRVHFIGVGIDILSNNHLEMGWLLLLVVPED